MASGGDGAPGSRPRRVVAIVNPATRGRSAELVAALQRALPVGAELDVRPTASPGHALALAHEAAAAADAVVAVGGDGTVADVASGILGSRVPLGIVPGGSTNIIARDLGIPTDPRQAAALIFGDHRLITLDVGRCGDRCFLHMAGAGLDSRFFERTNRALKRRIGWLAYLPAAAQTLLHPPTRFTIAADGNVATLTSPLVLVANGGSIITPALRLHPDIRTDDGWLDVLVVTATGPLAIARTLGRFASFQLERSPYVLRMRARHVVIDADPPLPVQLDGDVVEQTPATFDVAPAALRVIAPRG